MHVCTTELPPDIRGIKCALIIRAFMQAGFRMGIQDIRLLQCYQHVLYNGFCQAMRLYLVWDAETISEQTDNIVESLFEAVDADSDSDSDVKKKTKKRKKSSSSSSDDSGSSSESKAPNVFI